MVLLTDFGRTCGDAFYCVFTSWIEKLAYCVWLLISHGASMQNGAHGNV